MRHAVGEYSEDEWQRISDESSEPLEPAPRRAARRSGDEIARLAEVQGLIGGAPKRASRAAAGASAAAAGRGRHPSRSRRARADRAGASRHPWPRGRPARQAAAARSPRSLTAPPPVDELAFLKSVAPEEERKPAPRPAALAGGEQPRSVGQRGRSEGAGEPRARRRRPGKPAAGRSGQDAQVRGVRHAQPADGVVLRALRGGARRHLSSLRRSHAQRVTRWRVVSRLSCCTAETKRAPHRGALVVRTACGALLLAAP